MSLLNKKNCFILWLVCLSACVFLRSYELISLTEQATGFMKRETEPVAYALLTLIGLIVIFTAVFFKISHIKATDVKRKTVLTAVAALFSAAGVSADYLMNGFTVVPAFLAFFCSVLQVFTAVYFTACFFCVLFKKPISDKLLSLPLLFFILKSAMIFIQSSYHNVISDTVFDVAAYIFVMLFFLEYIRAATDIGAEKSPGKIVVFGTVASILCITASLSKFLVSAFLSPKALHDSASAYLLLLTTGTYIAVCTFSSIKMTTRKHE